MSDQVYIDAITQWRAQRLAALTAEDGWLDVIGRFWLEAGPAGVGSAADNDLQLPAGPARAGTISVDADNRVHFTPVGGEAMLLVTDPDNPPRFRVKNILFEVTTLDGRHALRARDVDAPARTHFPGLDYFPIDPRWRVVAQRLPLDAPMTLAVDTVTGDPSTVTVTHRWCFSHGGEQFELLPTHGTPDKPMLVFRDLTARDKTYGAARFLYAEPVDETRVVLDFNKAFSPPCAFTLHAVCPLPPRQNILPVRIEAGELAPPAAH